MKFPWQIFLPAMVSLELHLVVGIDFYLHH